MKVLSIKEPYASLIKDGIKKIETRSWKTNYRGDYSYGNIICKCKIIDCVYMTEEFILELRNTNYQEYICGLYEVGRYAWILDDIEIIDKISCNGKLGIWNF